MRPPIPVGYGVERMVRGMCFEAEKAKMSEEQESEDAAGQLHGLLCMVGGGETPSRLMSEAFVRLVLAAAKAEPSMWGTCDAELLESRIAAGAPLVGQDGRTSFTISRPIRIAAHAKKVVPESADPTPRRNAAPFPSCCHGTPGCPDKGEKHLRAMAVTWLCSAEQDKPSLATLVDLLERIEAATLERAAVAADAAMPDDDWYSRAAGEAIRAMKRGGR